MGWDVILAVVGGVLALLGMVFRLGKGSNVSRQRSEKVVVAEEKGEKAVRDIEKTHEDKTRPMVKELEESRSMKTEDKLNELIRDGRL